MTRDEVMQRETSKFLKQWQAPARPDDETERRIASLEDEQRFHQQIVDEIEAELRALKREGD